MLVPVDRAFPVAYDLANGLGSLDNVLSGLSPSLICFGSSVSLSTLRLCRYLQTRKTRYVARLVPLPRRDFHPQDRRRLSWRPGSFTYGTDCLS